MPWAITMVVLAGDGFAAVVLAPMPIGELGRAQAPVVFVTVAALGLQPLSTLLGAWLGVAWGTRATRTLG